MILEKGNPIKRLGIFVFYDKDGIVDDYVIYLLNDMMENLDRLVIAVNGKLNSEGRTKFEKITQDIFVRDNDGLDAAAYRQSMVEYCGWDEISKYDETVLFNDTFYGPFYPFSEIFTFMNDKDIDFWGMTEHYKTPVSFKHNKNGFYPQHIQSYFIVIRRKIASSYEFKKYWNEMPYYHSFDEVVQNHEVMFTQHFVDKGFKCGVYIDTEDWQEYETDNINYYTFAPYTLIKRKKYNIIKRKNFVLQQGHHLLQSGGEELREAMEYIDTYTNYNINMIWDNLLRLYNVGDLKNTLHLNYVISSISSKASDQFDKKAAVFAALQYDDLFGEASEYLSGIPSNIDVYVLINSNQKKEDLLQYLQSESKNIKICVTDSKEPINISLLRECSKRAGVYEYICILHDAKTQGEDGAYTVGASYRYNVWNNLIKNKVYIGNIIETFEKNSKLGLLAPPIPIHNQYFRTIGSLWTSHYNSSMDLIQDMKINCIASQEVSPFTNDMVFWCRTDALKPLFDWFNGQEMNIKSSKEIELILPYIAQHQGYFSGWIMDQDYASLQISNLQYMLGELVAIGESGMHYNAAYYLSFRELLSSGYGTVGVKGALKNYIKKHLPRPVVSLLKLTAGRIFKF
ncbi:MAG: rhamnan synthesis F family protein [Eubacteriales bacterium]|nr:rhamnan synthesis F family protein [Eubacteriales bacterium]